MALVPGIPTLISSIKLMAWLWLTNSTEHFGTFFQSYTSARWDKLLLVLFQNINLPANNRLKIDLSYSTDVFASANGYSFWTRPINIGN